eukprot:357316_1
MEKACLLIDEILDYINLKHSDGYVYKDLSVFQYSKLLCDAFKNDSKLLYDYFTDPFEIHTVMNVCVEISLWITAPNESIYQHEKDQYLSILNEYVNENVAQIILSYVTIYLKWTRFVDFPLENRQQHMDSHSVQSFLESNHFQMCYKWEKQLIYSQNDSIIHFAHACQDYLNIRTELLDTNIKYYINVYCFEKKDELWVGLVSKSSYHPSRSCRTYKNHFYYGTKQIYLNDGIFYYGGKQNRIYIYGGRLNDMCSAENPIYNKYDYYKINRDCNHGSIQGSDLVIYHPLSSYSAGDWMNFEIDFQNKSIVFYKNGIKQYQLENSKYFPEEECYFMVEVDRRGDKIYIEQTIDTDSAYKH